MNLLPPILLAATLLGLAAVHVYWAWAGQRASGEVIPTRDGVPLFEPGRAAALLVALLLLCATALVVWRAWFAALGPEWLPRVGVWTIAAVFALRAVGDFRFVGFFKRVRGTPFARNDTLLYSPLCSVLAALAAWLALAS